MGHDQANVVTMVRKLPPPFDAEHVAAQKRLAQQFMVQMPKDPREQRQVLKYMAELIDWQEDQNNGHSKEGGSETGA